jgi:cytoskeletal protein RodZ
VQVLESVNRGINAPFEAEGGAGIMVEARHALRGLRGPIVLVAIAAVVAWLVWPRLQSLQTAGPSATALPVSRSASLPATEAPQSQGLPASQTAGAVIDASGVASPGRATASAASAAPAGLEAASAVASMPAAVAAIPPAARPSAAVSALVSASASAPAPAPAPTGATAPLTVTAHDSSWVEVRDASGRILLSRLLDARDSVSLRGATPLRLTVGNAPATDVSFNGHAVDLASYTRDHVAHLELK